MKLRHTLSLPLLCLSAFTLQAHAAAGYSKEQVEGRYEETLTRCDDFEGQQRQYCEQRLKAERDGTLQKLEDAEKAPGDTLPRERGKTDPSERTRRDLEGDTGNTR